VTSVDVCIDEGYHVALKHDRAFFEVGTERLPHHQHAEAVKEGLWYRNCARCGSTLVLVIEEEPPLDRITDFDEVEKQTLLDRVSHLVSDEMIAHDRAERERAFAVVL
jgi:hypothetical protein